MTRDPQADPEEWTKPTEANLYHRDVLIGIISNIAVMDIYNWMGYIELTPAAQAFSDMFEYFGSEEQERETETPDEDKLPFDESLLDNWSIEDENGRREISFPVVFNGNEVYWRN